MQTHNSVNSSRHLHITVSSVFSDKLCHKLQNGLQQQQQQFNKRTLLLLLILLLLTAQHRHGCIRHHIFRPAVTLTFDLQNPTRSSVGASESLIKIVQVVHEIWCAQDSTLMACCDLNLQNLIRG